MALPEQRTARVRAAQAVETLEDLKAQVYQNALEGRAGTEPAKPIRGRTWALSAARRNQGGA